MLPLVCQQLPHLIPLTHQLSPSTSIKSGRRKSPSVKVRKFTSPHQLTHLSKVSAAIKKLLNMLLLACGLLIINFNQPANVQGNVQITSVDI